MNHNVRKETLHATVDSEAMALELQPRLQELSRTVFREVVERVFDEFSTPERHIRIERLTVDLGTISIGDFEWVAVNRLEHELREVLRRRVHEAEVQPSSQGRALTAADAQIELIERYLVTGTLPFWAQSSSFSLADALAALATSDPEGLANLLARHGTNALVRDRLSHQLSRDVLRVRVIDPVVTRLDRPALEYLIRQLDPIHADRIEAEVDAFDERLRTSGQADISRARRVLWSIAIAERLRVHGESFDSVSFARSLREGVARSNARSVDAQQVPSATEQHPPHRTTPAPEFEPESGRHDVGDKATEKKVAAAPSSIVDATVPAAAEPAFDRADEPVASVTPADDQSARLAAAVRHEYHDLDQRPVEERPWFESRFLNQLDTTNVVQRVVAALLDVAIVDGEVDTENEPRRDADARESALEAVTLAADDVRDWSVARIRAVLRARAQVVAGGELAHEPSSTHLLLRLIELEVNTARQFIGALIAMGLRPSVLIDERLTSRDIEILQRLLSVESSAAVSRFVSAIAALPGTPRSLHDTDRIDVLRDRSHEPESGLDIWEASRIVTELRNRAQAARVAGEPSSTSLLVRLIEQDATVAREFVSALREAGLRPSSLVDGVPSPAAIDVLQRLLSSRTAKDLTALSRAVPEPSRVDPTQADGALRAALIAEALDHDRSVPAGAAAGEAPAAVGLDERRTDERIDGVDQVEDASLDAAGIVAVLRRRALSGTVAQEPSSMSLLLRLIDEDLEAARQFMRSLRDAGVQPSSLADEFGASSTVERIAMLLSADAAQTVTLLYKVLHEAVRRAGDGAGPLVDSAAAAEVRLQRILLREVLDHDIAGVFFSPARVTRTLRRVFGSTMSPATRELLIATANRLIEAEQGPSAPIAGLVDALREVADVSLPGPDSTTVLEPGPFDAAGFEALSADESMAIQWLRRRGHVTDGAAAGELDHDHDHDHDELRQAVRRAIERAPTAVRRAVTELLEDPRARQWWVSALSDAELSALARLLEPRAHDFVVEAANVLFSAWRSLVPETASSRGRRGDFWSVVLEVLAGTRSPSAVTAGGAAASEAVPQSGGQEARGAEAERPGSTSPAPLGAEAVSAESTPSDAVAPDGREATADAALQDGERPAPERARRSASKDADLPESAGVEPPEPIGTGFPASAITELPVQGRSALADSESKALPGSESTSGVPAVPEPPRALGDAGALGDQTGVGVDIEDWPLTQLTRRFFAVFGADREPLLGEPGRRREIGEALARAATRDATTAGHTALRATLVRDRSVLLALARGEWPGDPAPTHARQPLRRGPDPSAPRVDRPRMRTAFSMDEGGRDIGEEPIYIANAGLILINPFLPQLFQALDVLERSEDGAVYVAKSEVSRVVHLLQSLVDGRTSAPEPLLCLNKILCGVPLQTPIARSIEPQPRDLKACTTLLSSMIAHWPILSGTSIAGLQETFLQREGRLEKTAEGWRLVVQRKTLDVLLDHIPWSISTVFHGWMAAPIYVTW